MARARLLFEPHARGMSAEYFCSRWWKGMSDYFPALTTAEAAGWAQVAPEGTVTTLEHDAFCACALVLGAFLRVRPAQHGLQQVSERDIERPARVPVTRSPKACRSQFAF